MAHFKAGLSRIDKMLINAAKAGDNAKVAEAIKLGAKIHVINNSALRRAAENGHKNTVALLLGHSDIHADLDNALNAAAAGGHTDIVALLLDRGADIHAEKDRALSSAAAEGHKDTVALLLDRGADINAGNELALCSAASYGYKEMVALLLDRGADIHADNQFAFHFALSNGHMEIAELLLKRGADIHADNDQELRRAAQNENKETALFLMRHGANPRAKPEVYENAFEEFDGDAFKDTKLAEWLNEVKQAVPEHFKSGKPAREQCFISTENEAANLHDRVLDACVTDQFIPLLAMPLIESTAKADRQLFQNIWEALPAHWQDQNQNVYMQFIKEGGLNPIVGKHTSMTQHSPETFTRPAVR